jgi:cation transporter-like permease
MEMQEQLSQDPAQLPALSAARGMNRLLANRQLWKNAIYSLALITYLCSFLFFGLAVADVRDTGGSTASLVDLLVALYFLVQVIFLFVLSSIVERRRQSQPITFPDRRDRD